MDALTVEIGLQTERAIGLHRFRNMALTTLANDLFTDRQLVALTTFSNLVGEARERVRQDSVAASMPDDGTPLRDKRRGGNGVCGGCGGVFGVSR